MGNINMIMAKHECIVAWMIRAMRWTSPISACIMRSI